MSNEIEQSIEHLTTLRDELRVKLHLAGMDAREKLSWLDDQNRRARDVVRENAHDHAARGSRRIDQEASSAQGLARMRLHAMHEERKSRIVIRPGREQSREESMASALHR